MIAIQSTFETQLQTILLSFLAVVVPAAGFYIRNLLMESRTNALAAKNAAQAAADASHINSQKMDAVVEQTNGVNQKLHEHIEAQASIIETQANTIAKQNPTV